ncbi:MAG: sulfotransferase family 2 domain-containing protein [Vannielia sp.]|uniref:sulfotransferase family 2 domain-containing protein n=1 Tax=Vannielia sp. TaxID=2813045 RepID=UPI003B8DC982
MGWRGYIDEARGVVFFWSQKAACTTLFEFLTANMAERPADKHHFHDASKPTGPCREAIEGRGFASVILVRHPVTRIISAFFNKFCLYEGRRLAQRDDLESFARALHDQFCRRQGVKLAENLMSFEQFLATIEAEMRARDKPHLPINGHWETQMPPWLAAQGFRHDVVLHVEALDRELGALAGELGMVWQPRRSNSTRTARRPEPGYLGDIPARRVALHGFGYDNFITPATLAQIRRMYAVDFESFGYPDAP